MQINADTVKIDEVSTLEMVRMFNEEDNKVAGAVSESLEEIARAVDAIASALKKGGRLLYIGSGTSGKLAVVDASEIPPTFGLEDGVVVGIISGGEGAVAGWKEDTEDDEGLALQDLKQHRLTAEDILVGISASGNTPYVLSGIRHAKEQGCKTVGISCSEGGALRDLADIGIEINVGPEVIAGSTRLKAGTAQKMVLNMLSSCAMIKLGKTYGNLMVNVRPINDKLKKRVIEILKAAAGCSTDEANEALTVANGNTKAAILMLVLGVGLQEAEALLERHDGNVKKAVRGD